MPLAFNGALSASDINNELNNCYPYYNSIPYYNTFSTNDPGARMLTCSNSTATISYSSFNGTFQMDANTDGNYTLLGWATDGYNPIGFISSNNITKNSVTNTMTRLCYNPTQKRTELHIASASSLGNTYITSVTVGNTQVANTRTLYTTSATTYGFSTNNGGFSYWYWYGPSNVFYGDGDFFNFSNACTISPIPPGLLYTFPPGKIT